MSSTKTRLIACSCCARPTAPTFVPGTTRALARAMKTRRRLRDLLLLFAFGICAAACGSGSQSDETGTDGSGGDGRAQATDGAPSPTDASVDGAHPADGNRVGPDANDGAVADEPVPSVDGASPSPGDATSSVDSSSSIDASSKLDASVDDASSTDANTVKGDAASACPMSCPAGKVVVSWNESSPGFPGASGCDCEPEPCDGGGTSCSCESACAALHPDLGPCCGWSNGILNCVVCG